MTNGSKEKINLMTGTQIAAMLGVSKSTIRRYAEKGLIGTYQLAGKGSAVRYYVKGRIDE